MEKFLVNSVWNMKVMSTHNLHTEMAVSSYMSLYMSNFFWRRIWSPGNVNGFAWQWRLTYEVLTSPGRGWGGILQTIWKRLIREHNITIIAISNAHEIVLCETSHFCARQRKQMGDEKRYELFSSEKFQVDTYLCIL